MNNIQAIQSKISEAKAGIEAALFSGDDTQSLRTTLADLEADLAQVERDAADAAQALQRAKAKEADQRAAEAVNAAHQTLLVAAGPDVVAGVKMSTPDADPAVEAAAARLSAARDHLEREQAVHQEKAAKVSALRGRLAEKTRARDEILARRIGGAERPGDGGEVLLLAADIENLRSLVTAAEAHAEACRPTAALRLVSEAETVLSAAQRQAVYQLKQARLLELERAFLDAHAEVVQAGAAVGQHNRFALFRASNELRMITYGA